MRSEDLGTFDQPWSKNRMCEIGLCLGQIADRVRLGGGAAPQDGQYTGRTTDIPCFREGKVTRLERWLLENGLSLEGSTFYSDSRNDLPLLELVDRPVAVDPCPELRAIAEQRGWPVLSLRG